MGLRGLGVAALEEEGLLLHHGKDTEAAADVCLDWGGHGKGVEVGIDGAAAGVEVLVVLARDVGDDDPERVARHVAHPHVQGELWASVAAEVVELGVAGYLFAARLVEEGLDPKEAVVAIVAVAEGGGNIEAADGATFDLDGLHEAGGGGKGIAVFHQAKRDATAVQVGQRHLAGVVDHNAIGLAQEEVVGERNGVGAYGKAGVGKPDEAEAGDIAHAVALGKEEFHGLAGVQDGLHHVVALLAGQRQVDIVVELAAGQQQKPG